jgi:hypothetical protein
MLSRKWAGRKVSRLSGERKPVSRHGDDLRGSGGGDGVSVIRISGPKASMQSNALGRRSYSRANSLYATYMLKVIKLLWITVL